MKYIVRHLLVIIVIVASAGCSVFENDQEVDVRLTTDKDLYLLDSALEIQLTVTNYSETPVFFLCTGQVYLQELNNGEVEQTWMVHGFEECLGRNPIEKNRPKIVDLFLSEEFLNVWLPTFQWKESVSYRLVMDLYKTAELQELIDLSERSTPLFQVVKD